MAGGLKLGIIEGGVHAMKELWADADTTCTEVVELVDTSNAFDDSLDRQAGLFGNCWILWYRVSLFLFSTAL